jgi:hypothetical protein
MRRAVAPTASYEKEDRRRPLVGWQRRFGPCREDGVMWNPASPTTNALALSMAAAIAFLGSALMLKAGRSWPNLTGGGTADGQPGFLLLAVVILLAVAGLLLLAMAGKQFLGLRRRPHPR